HDIKKEEDKSEEDAHFLNRKLHLCEFTPMILKTQIYHSLLGYLRSLKTNSIFAIKIPDMSPNGQAKKFIDVEAVIRSKNPKLLKFLPRFILNYIKKVLHEDFVN